MRLPTQTRLKVLQKGSFKSKPDLAFHGSYEIAICFIYRNRSKYLVRPLDGDISKSIRLKSMNRTRGFTIASLR